MWSTTEPDLLPTYKKMPPRSPVIAGFLMGTFLAPYKACHSDLMRFQGQMKAMSSTDCSKAGSFEFILSVMLL